MQWLPNDPAAVNRVEGRVLGEMAYTMARFAAAHRRSSAFPTASRSLLE